MTRTATRIAAAAAGLGLLAGCGTQNATDKAAEQAQQAKTTAQQAAQQQLSSRGEAVLMRAQALAVNVSRTAQAYVNKDLAPRQAQQRLGQYEERAKSLVDEARTLPATSRARDRLQQLTQTISRATSQARMAVEGNQDTARVTDQARKVRQSARDTYEALRDRIPAGTRQEVEQALSQLGA